MIASDNASRDYFSRNSLIIAPERTRWGNPDWNKLHSRICSFQLQCHTEGARHRNRIFEWISGYFLEYANRGTEVTDNWLFKHEEGISEYQEFLTEVCMRVIENFLQQSNPPTHPNVRQIRTGKPSQKRVLKAPQTRCSASVQGCQRRSHSVPEGRRAASAPGTTLPRVVAGKLTHAILTFGAAAAGGVRLLLCPRSLS